MLSYNNITPQNYVPIDWEAYLKVLDYRVKKMQFWLSPAILPITVMITLLLSLLIKDLEDT